MLLLLNGLGLGAQTGNADTAAVTAAAAAAGLLPSMTVQNLATLAAMTQPSLGNTANTPSSAQLTNTAALLCKSNHQYYSTLDLIVINHTYTNTYQSTVNNRM